MPGTIYQTEYAPPVLRAPSPASSIGTAYAQDQTSFSDSEMSLAQDEFERKWEGLIGLRNPIQEEMAADLSIRIPYPCPEEGTVEATDIRESILRNLRRRIQQITEDDMFEQALLRGSQIGMERPPSTNDIDAIMRSMMPMSISDDPQSSYAGTMSTMTAGNNTVSEGPWNNREYLHGFGTGMESFPTSEGTAGRRRMNSRKA